MKIFSALVAITAIAFAAQLVFPTGDGVNTSFVGFVLLALMGTVGLFVSALK